MQALRNKFQDTRCCFSTTNGMMTVRMSLLFLFSVRYSPFLYFIMMYMSRQVCDCSHSLQSSLNMDMLDDLRCKSTRGNWMANQGSIKAWMGAGSNSSCLMHVPKLGHNIFSSTIRSNIFQCQHVCYRLWNVVRWRRTKSPPSRVRIHQSMAPSCLMT